MQGLLAQYDRIVALGEVRRLGGLMRGGSLCSCGSPVQKCPFWSTVLEVKVPDEGKNLHLEPVSGLARKLETILLIVLSVTRWLRFPTLMSSTSRKYVTSIFAIYRKAAISQSASIVIDTSKLPFNLLRLWVVSAENIVPVFMVRDGRAVIYSMMRRTGIDSCQASIMWRRSIRSLLLVKRLVAPRSSFLRYEDLCKDNHKAIAPILNSMGHQANKSKCLGIEHHIVGGSPSIGSYDLPVIHVNEDLQWKRGLSSEDLLNFELIAGKTNLKLGYDDVRP